MINFQRQEGFCFLFSIPHFGRANVKDVHLNVGGKKKMYPVSLCLFLRVKIKKRCKRMEMVRLRCVNHEVYFEERTFTSVPNRMRMCMGMHARIYLDTLC